nr:metal-dependent hydrolase [Aeromonas dhakensis]
MTAQGHLLFSVTCTLVAHKLQLTPALADASLWQTVPAALASALLPDLDHPKSVLGQRLPWISKPLSRLFGHRGFTHSLLAVAVAIWGLNQQLPPDTLPVGVKDALIIGYLSHLLGTGSPRPASRSSGPASAATGCRAGHSEAAAPSRPAFVPSPCWPPVTGPTGPAR